MEEKSNGKGHFRKYWCCYTIIILGMTIIWARSSSVVYDSEYIQGTHRMVWALRSQFMREVIIPIVGAIITFGGVALSIWKTSETTRSKTIFEAKREAKKTVITWEIENISNIIKCFLDVEVIGATCRSLVSDISKESKKENKDSERIISLKRNLVVELKKLLGMISLINSLLDSSDDLILIKMFNAEYNSLLEIDDSIQKSSFDPKKSDSSLVNVLQLIELQTNKFSSKKGKLLKDYQNISFE